MTQAYVPQQLTEQQQLIPVGGDSLLITGGEDEAENSVTLAGESPQQLNA
jgi:hypothetical protein